MTKGKGWEQFKEYLQGQIHNKWLDPRAPKNKKEFEYQYAIAWGSAQGAEEMLRWVEEMVALNKHLIAKQRGELKVEKFSQRIK